jgi:hypothetical protein
MKKIILTIILVAILSFGGIGYYVYLNNRNQVVSSGDVFNNTKNYFPLGTSSTQPPIAETKTETNSPTVKINTPIQPTQKTGLRIITNGITNPEIDSQYKNYTTYQQDGKSLDATTDNYVTVPKNTIPIGSRVYIINLNTGRDVWGVVGDYGPYEGISLYAAEQLGIWQAGMGMKLLPHTLTYKYYER